MLIIALRIVIFVLFLNIILILIKKLKYLDLAVITCALFTVTYGEALNLFSYKMAVYNGIDGIPLYIIFGGAMLSWGLFLLSSYLIKKVNFQCIFCNIFILVACSIFLPIIEIIGLKSGLWYWTRPYAILSLAWFLGVWKFYFLFIASPALIAVFITTFTSYKNSCCIVKH